MKKNEQSLWDRMKCINIHLRVFPEEGEREEQEVHMKNNGQHFSKSDGKHSSRNP